MSEHKILLDGWFIENDPDEGQEAFYIERDGDQVRVEAPDGKHGVVTIKPSEARAVAHALLAVAAEIDREDTTP